MTPVWIPMPRGRGAKCPLTGLSRPTLYRLMGSGRIDTRKIGAVRLIRASSLLSFIEEAPGGASVTPEESRN